MAKKGITEGVVVVVLFWKEDAVQKRRARRKSLRGTKNEGRGSLGTQKSKQKKGGTGEADEKARGGLFTLFFFFGAKREVQAGEKEGVSEEKNAKKAKRSAKRKKRRETNEQQRQREHDEHDEQHTHFTL